MRKPDSAPYEYCINYLNLAPSSIVFLDDQKENVEAAGMLGMQGILVTSSAQMHAELNNLRIETQF